MAPLLAFRKPITLAERELVKQTLVYGGCFRFGSEQRWIDISFLPDGTSDIVRIERSDGASAEGAITHGDENQMVSAIEQVKAQAAQWVGGAN